MKIGFLVRHLNKKTHKKQFKVVYEWQELEKIDNCPYTRSDYNYIKLLEQDDVFQKAVAEFRRKFPIKITLSDFLRLASFFWQEEKYIPLSDDWPLTNLLFSSKKQINVKISIAVFVAKYTLSPVLRKQLENILFYGFVDERICKPKKLIQIYMPQPDEEDFYSSVGRAPIEIHLRSGTITQKEFFEEIRKEWKEMQQYFQKYPTPQEMALSDRDLQILSAKNAGKSYKEIVDENYSKDMPVEEYDKGSVENCRETIYRIKKKQRKIIKSP